MAYFGRVEYPPSFENRAIVFDLSLCSVLLRLGSDSEIKESDINLVSKNQQESGEERVSDRRPKR